MPRKKLLQKALDLVNDARYAMGLDPLERFPKGVPGSAIECPLTYALEGTVVLEDCVLVPPKVVGALLCAWRTKAAFDEDCGSPAVMLPRTLRKFVASFDRGDIPELIAPKE